jgi:hypothetical protein
MIFEASLKVDDTKYSYLPNVLSHCLRYYHITNISSNISFSGCQHIPSENQFIEQRIFVIILVLMASILQTISWVFTKTSSLIYSGNTHY